MDDTLYCRFVVAGAHLAIPTPSVKEVVPASNVMPIPGAPGGVAGYVNLRGNLHIVLDIAPLLFPHGRRRPWVSLIVLREHVGESSAIGIDQLCDMVTIDADCVNFPARIAKRPDGALADRDHPVTGHARLADGLVTLLDPSALYDACLTREPEFDETIQAHFSRHL